MELIIDVLMLFVLLACLFKLSLWRWWQQVAYGLLLAAFAAWSVRYAVEQSKTQIADYLQNVDALQTMAILVTIESAVGIAYALAWLGGEEARGRGAALVRRLLRWYPSLLMFPVVFYLLTQTVFAATGVPFATTAWLFAGGIAVLVPLLSQVVRSLLPDEESRVEIYLLLVVAVCILGLLSTQHGRMVYAAQEAPIDWPALLLTLSLFLLMALAGYAAYRLRHRYRIGGRKGKQ